MSATTAYHEAGHALWIASLGWRIDRVSIRRRGDSAGRVQCHEPIPLLATLGDRQAWAICRAAMLLSGHAAVTLARGLTVPVARGLRDATHRTWLRGGRIPGVAGSHEFGAAFTALCEAYPEDEAARELDRVFGDVCGWLAERWPAVEALAVLLVKRGELSGIELEALVPPPAASRSA